MEIKNSKIITINDFEKIKQDYLLLLSIDDSPLIQYYFVPVTKEEMSDFQFKPDENNYYEDFLIVDYLSKEQIKHFLNCEKENHNDINTENLVIELKRREIQEEVKFVKWLKKKGFESFAFGGSIENSIFFLEKVFTGILNDENFEHLKKVFKKHSFLFQKNQVYFEIDNTYIPKVTIWKKYKNRKEIYDGKNIFDKEIYKIINMLLRE
jgi:hypothetical protein